MTQIDIDICTQPKSGDGYVDIVVAVDYFSKHVIARPIMDKSSLIVAAFLYEEVYTRFGIPTVQINDQGLELCRRCPQFSMRSLVYGCG